jgi:hypothetical protein
MMLIVETITWKPHVETAIEIAVRESDAGRKVTYCNLRDGLPQCEDRKRIHAVLDLPRTRMARSKALIESRGIPYLGLRHAAAARRDALAAASKLMRGCRDVEDVKRLSYGAFGDIGWGVISSAASVLQDSTISPSTHGALLTRLLASSMLVHDRVSLLIDELRPDSLMVFNGRFATTRAALRAAESKGVPWQIHERGADKDHYWVADCLPHDLDRIQSLILDQWSAEKEAAARLFFTARRDRIERDWHSFTKRQEYGRLPVEMQTPGEWVTFFTSSEDEMFAIGDRFESALFPDQRDAILALRDAVAKVDGLRMCIRVHPHVALKASADKEKWRELALPGVVMVGPEDRTDTYALIERSRVVCTFGSTVGIEATYWGRPSLLFSRSYYDRLDACEVVTSRDHIERFLRDPVVRPAQRTLAYGAFWALLGERYRHYRAIGLHHGRILEVDLDAGPVMRIARWIGRRLFPDRR